MASGESAGGSARKISLRPARADDAEFLIRVYASTREEEMAAWGWSTEQQGSFVRMQYDARQRGYGAAYPAAAVTVILVGEVPAGSLIVARRSDEIRLVDISLLAEFRSGGVGGRLIAALIAEAAVSKSALRLSVRRGNRAAHLYARLGFIAKSEDGMYCEMEWIATRATESNDERVTGE